MKLTLVESKLLKDSISIISELVIETRFRITKDHLELIAMDPANVAMVIFRMPSNVFAEYEVKEDTTLSMNLNDLKQVLRRAKPSDTLILEKKDNKLSVTLKDKNKRTFSLPLLDLEERTQKVPQLTNKANVQLLSSLLVETIEDMDIVSESVTFKAEPEKLTVQALGDLKKADVEIEKSDSMTIICEEEQKSKYSIEYLKKMMQGSKIANKVSLKFSNDYPLTMEFLEKDKLSLTFILAPRVDND